MIEIRNNQKEAGILRNSKVKNQKSKLQFKMQKKGDKTWIPASAGMTASFLSHLRRQGSRSAF